MDMKSTIISESEEEAREYYKPTEEDRKLTAFIVDHCGRWREYRDQNHMDDWLKYERIFRGIWSETDKTRGSERSRIISPATQQAIETRHAEIMEAIFGQGEYFDIKDDLNDQNGPLDVEKIKAQLYEDFAQDKIRKSIDQIVLLAEIYGTGIGEIVVSQEKQYKPMTVPISGTQAAYGAGEKDRISVKLVPVSPKNFLFDPNCTSIDDAMGVAIEKYVSIHKIAQGIESGKYKDVDITTLYKTDELDVSQEDVHFKDEKVLLLTYYGLVPREFIEDINVERLVDRESDDYEDMVEAIVVVANDGLLLKAEESPYMMRDRPVISYQADTMPNRLLGRGTCEKAYNSQSAIDGSARSHMDALALTVSPMIAVDATRIPKGAKFEVKPGKAFMTNGDPNGILMPFKFGTNDGQAMQTAKEFERMLLMATGTIDSNGQVSQVSRDGNMDMATATMIKKYKRTLVNFQEDFLIPFIYKATWRYMQFDPERYPAVDIKFIPTATLGIIAREYEQKQLAFLIQTLGAQSPLTPILMAGVIKHSSLSNREEMLEQMEKSMQPDPQQQQMDQQKVMLDMQGSQADTAKKMAEAKKANIEAELAPMESKTKMIAALSNNLDDTQEGKDFERRIRLAEVMLKEKDIDSNKEIAIIQNSARQAEKSSNDDYLRKASELMQ
jgi:hypothetical protein